ncbi:unnamed protein product [Phytophthora lilii]|uniref:Unnamed protein product n=1 Tax=Phytophthora lilii TaxID=2077276 RepID=A0A9W6WQD6_9STRA|nr:unnamed protein product [Phytophthora lilii]
MIANREKQLRVSAEIQHKELRAAVAFQATLIVDLNRIFNKRVCRRVIAVTLLTEHRLQMEKNDCMLFEDYFERLNVIYREVPNAYTPLACPAGGYNIVRKANDELEYLDSSLLIRLSLQFHTVCDLMRNVVVRPHRQIKRNPYTRARLDNNDIAFRCDLVCPRYGGNAVRIAMRFVGRLYIEKVRAVVVWRCFMEGEDEFAGIRMEESGWCTAYRSERSLTLVQKHSRLIPLGTTAPKPTVDEFSGLTLRCVREDDAALAALSSKMEEDGGVA